MAFITEQLVFYFTLIFILVLPGYCLLLALERGRKQFSLIERLPLSVGSSILVIDFLMLTLGRWGILLNRWSIILAILGFTLICLGIAHFFPKSAKTLDTTDHQFSRYQTIAIVAILFLTIFIRVAYLRNAIVPASTDLGHHMYWVNAMATEGTLPNYQARDITTQAGHYAISDSKPISDFIIGEHLIFGAVAIVSGISVISYFPVLVLFVINIMSILALFILALRFFAHHPQGKSIAIFALLLIGPLFAIAPPQAKFVGGGVIGNLLANLLLPIALYSYYRALTEKRTGFLALALFFSMGLFYTHHLTALIFLLTFICSLGLVLITQFRKLKTLAREWGKLIISLPVLSFCCFAIGFVFLIHIPSYLTNQAVDTVVGEISKKGHGGLSLTQFKFTVGEPRLAFGLMGLLITTLLFLQRSRQKEIDLGYLFLFGWALPISAIAIAPQLFILSIPSARAANYASYPLAVIAAFAFIEMMTIFKTHGPLKTTMMRFAIPLSTLAFGFLIFSGMYDNAAYQEKPANAQAAIQTLQASAYLAPHVKTTTTVLKDHIYLAADSWIKLYFMRDYNFPIYRANLERYENGIDRKESCTLWMISTPSTPESDQCYHELNVGYTMVNRKMDAPQFEQSAKFNPVYVSDSVSIFQRNDL